MGIFKSPTPPLTGIEKIEKADNALMDFQSQYITGRDDALADNDRIELAIKALNAEKAANNVAIERADGVIANFAMLLNQKATIKSE